MSLLWLCVLAVLGSSHGARILDIFPTASISHQLPFQTVMKALASRGHHVTVISTDPLKVPHPNYVDIDLSFTYDHWVDAKDELQKGVENPSIYKVMLIFVRQLTKICHLQLSSEQIQSFLRSQQKFDLVLIEDLLGTCMYGIVHKVGSPPVIGILSFGGTAYSFQQMGSPFNPAVDPDVMCPYDDRMTFWERTNNFLYWLWTHVYLFNIMRMNMEEISRQYFGDDIPSVWESEANISLLMLNNHWSLSYPRPVVPAVITLGSLHINPVTKPLPKDLQVFLDNATEGFVFFSLGSNVRSDKVPEEKRKEFLAAFAELPQRVLWKWEADSLPGQPDNVLINKWFPQQDVLAHPNCCVFITQGGLQSFHEATHHAVPLVGIPFMGDQHYNVKKMVNAGVGLQLEMAEVSKDTILDAVRQVINNSSYRDNMRRLSAITRDEPEPPLQRAVWWVEYVLRHNGAKHLRSAALDLAWPQHLLLDVMGFLLALILFTVFGVWVTLRKALRIVRNMTSTKLKKQ